MTTIPIFESIAGLQRQLAQLRADGKIVLVPTMGALHDGHLALIRAARAQAAHVIVSIFVNPTQFAPHEDFDAYPRNLAQDVKLISALGLDGITVFAPGLDEMYPMQPITQFALGEIATRWEGAARPTHFAGVALVVSKLFNIVQPDAAFFGEKDFQQLQIIRQITRDLSIPVEIIGVPIVRENSGLARSSRNAYLTEAERSVIAPKLFAAMQSAARAIVEGVDIEKILAEQTQEIIAAGFSSVDYLAYADAQTLAPLPRRGPRAGRLLVAARLGKTRLIDNLAVS